MIEMGGRFQKKEEYSDGKYSVYSFSDGAHKFTRLHCDRESICILPFDLNDQGQIKHVYLAKYQDRLLGGMGLTCVCKTFDRDRFDAHYPAMEDEVKNAMRLERLDLDDVYFLGKVKHGVPFSKQYLCYGVNLSQYINDADDFSSIQSDGAKKDSIDRVRFSRVAKGEIQDSLVLACSLLLLSYFSE